MLVNVKFQFVHWPFFFPLLISHVKIWSHFCNPIVVRLSLRENHKFKHVNCDFEIRSKLNALLYKLVFSPALHTERQTYIQTDRLTFDKNPIFELTRTPFFMISILLYTTYSIMWKQNCNLNIFIICKDQHIIFRNMQWKWCCRFTHTLQAGQISLSLILM